jgi:hypothetical protein
MNGRHLGKAFAASLLALGWAILAICLGQGLPAYGQPAPPPPPVPAEAAGNPAAANADPNVEVLTRGPVHEAYATPGAAQPTAGLIVPKRPADPVEEMPPEVKPEGENSLWIPGYWSWDDDRKDFIWVSGVWRVPPPDYRWVPGYWQEAQGGFQWVSGFWQHDATEEVEYLPEPQPSLDQGPSSPSPGENHFWVPGSWRWQTTHYVWGPGYWAVAQPDWIWVPARYYWTPRGWVYSPGYWDYPLDRRGLLFSPVVFLRPVPVYRPAVCVDVGILTFSLFSRPSYCHYYFGDYYGAAYVGLGFRPWFHHHDHLYTYYRWHHTHHGDPHWDRNIHAWHDYYRAHPDMRPPHTLAAQQALLASKAAHSRPDIQKLAIARPVTQLKSDPKAFVKVQNVSHTQQTVIQQSVKQTIVFQKGRRDLETQGLAAGAGAVAGKLPSKGPKSPEKVSLSKLPDFRATQLKGAGAGPAAKITTGPGPEAKVAPGIGPAAKVGPAAKLEHGPAAKISTPTGPTLPSSKVKPPPKPATGVVNPGTPSGPVGPAVKSLPPPVTTVPVQPKTTIQPKTTVQPPTTVSPKTVVQPKVTVQPKPVIQPKATVPPPPTIQPKTPPQPKTFVQPKATNGGGEGPRPKVERREGASGRDRRGDKSKDRD